MSHMSLLDTSREAIDRKQFFNDIQVDTVASKLLSHNQEV